MKKLLICASLFVVLISSAIAQNKTYVGLEAGLTSDIYEVADRTNNLKTTPLPGGALGFILRKEIKNVLFIETGILRKNYSYGFAFRTPDMNTGSGSSMQADIIPIRLGTKINLRKDKIYVVPVIGYAFCLNSSGASFISGSVRQGSDSADYDLTGNYGSGESYSLLQTGIGFEFKIKNSLLLSVSGNYYTGFKKVIRQNINYSVNNTPGNGMLFSKGEFWSVGISLKYAISNFWMKNKE